MAGERVDEREQTVLRDEIDLGEHKEDRAVEFADEAEEEFVLAGPIGAGAFGSGGWDFGIPGPQMRGTWGTRSFWIRCYSELDAARCVHEDQDEVAGFEGFVDLLQHAAVEMRAGLVDAGSIDKDDLRSRMHALARRNLDDSGDAVTGGLRLGGDDGDFFAGEGVEQRAFADVGPAEYGDESGFQRGALLSSIIADELIERCTICS